MKLENIFELNYDLLPENRFSREQWTAIVDEAYARAKEWAFDLAVENFYTEWLRVDYDDCEDLITDIQNGNGDAFEKFIDDIMNFYKNEN